MVTRGGGGYGWGEDRFQGPPRDIWRFTRSHVLRDCDSPPRGVLLSRLLPNQSEATVLIIADYFASAPLESSENR